MTDRELLLCIMDAAVKEVTLRMTGIELVRVEADQLPADGQPRSELDVEVRGCIGFTLAYGADDRLLRAIAERMKRRPVADMEEAAEYDKEYFNVICGHVVSAFNRSRKTSLRFGVPRYRRKWDGRTGEEPLVLCYRSREGAAQMLSAG